MDKEHMAPFPQANDFEKVIKVINVEPPEKLKDYGYMSLYLEDISDRQVDYYITACSYLGLITPNKEFSKLGECVRAKVGIEQMAELSRIIISDEVFGFVYFQQKFLGTELERSEVIEIMRERVSLNSEAMYERRASTIMSWLRWIKSKEEY